MRTTLRAIAAIALLASACGAPTAPDDAATDELRWRWCRSKTVCKVKHTFWKYCVDTSSDPRNCGGCNIRCDAGEACVSGACTPTCDAGLVSCGGACTDIASDAANCGGCGIACGTGQVCQAGHCTGVCPGTETNCGTPDAVACTDTSSDPANCGACGNACSASDVCSGGTCTALCNGETYCSGTDGVPYCTNTDVDSGNCGGCGNVCQGGTSCVAASCVCPDGYADCGQGCQDVQIDRQNCGACGVTCAGNEFCQAGACTLWCGDLTRCAVNGADTCIDTTSDPQNCGGCGVSCTSGLCTNGSCAPCASGLSYCDGACVDTAGDAANCGSCGNACAAGETCAGGGCVAPPPANGFEPSVTFTDVTGVPVTTMGFDGTSLWTGGSFNRSTGAVNWAWYGRSGSPANACASAVTSDTRGIFSPGAGALPRPVYMRLTNSGFIYQMNGCSLQSQAVASLGAGSGIAWTSPVNVVMTDDRAQYVALSGGRVHRWTACSTAPASPTPTCAYLGATQLQGWNQGDFAGEDVAPQNVRVAIAGDKLLTYSNGKLSVWDAAGNRVRAVDLVGAGTTADSHYSLSFADGLVWILDAQGGTWRGYLVGL